MNRRFTGSRVGLAGPVFHPAVLRANVVVRAWVGRLGVALALLGFGSSAARAEAWSDATGKYKTEAEFLGVKDGKVQLKKKSDGATIAVPYATLSAESQQLAQRLASAGRGAKLDAAAEFPDAAPRLVIEGLNHGDLRVVWDALPASYQQDVHELVRAFAGNMDPNLWKDGADILNRVRQVLETKKALVLAHPDIAPQAKLLEPDYDKIVDVLAAVTTSELSDLETLKTIDLGDFFNGSGRNLLSRIWVLTEFAKRAGATNDDFENSLQTLAKLKNVKYTTVKLDGDSATLRIEVPGLGSQERKVVRVEGKWLFPEIVEGWAAWVSKGKDALQQIGASLKTPEIKNSAVAAISAGKTLLARVETASNQEEFNQAIDALKALYPRTSPRVAPEQWDQASVEARLGEIKAQESARTTMVVRDTDGSYWTFTVGDIKSITRAAIVLQEDARVTVVTGKKGSPGQVAELLISTANNPALGPYFSSSTSGGEVEIAGMKGTVKADTTVNVGQVVLP